MDIQNQENIDERIERLTQLNDEFSNAIKEGNIQKQFDILEAYKKEKL